MNYNRILSCLLVGLISLPLTAQISTISDGETGSSVRTKLNAVIAEINGFDAALDLKADATDVSNADHITTGTLDDARIPSTIARDAEIPTDAEILTAVESESGRDIAADGAALDTALQPGDDVSELANDAGYLTAASTLDADNITTGTIDDERIDDDIARDSEVVEISNPKAFAGGVAFDGVAGYGRFPFSNVDLGIGENDVSICLMVSMHSAPANVTLLGALRLNSINNVVGGFGITYRATYDFFSVRHEYNSNDVQEIISDTSVGLNTWHSLVVTFDGTSKEVTLYQNGLEVGQDAFTDSSDFSSSVNWALGIKTLTNGDVWDATLNSFAHASFRDVGVFNRLLSSDEAAALYNQGLRGWLAAHPEDKWADNTELTSGTLEVGARYRITDYQAGDDFANVGAASNSTGVEFVANDAAPTTWANASSVTKIGCLAALPLGDGIGYQLHDQSDNHYDVIITDDGAHHLQPRAAGYLRGYGLDASANDYVGSASRDMIPADCVIESVQIIDQGGESSTGTVIQLSDGTNHASLHTAVALTADAAISAAADTSQDMADRRIRTATTTGASDIDVRVNYRKLND